MTESLVRAAGVPLTRRAFVAGALLVLAGCGSARSETEADDRVTPQGASAEEGATDTTSDDAVPEASREGEDMQELSLAIGNATFLVRLEEGETSSALANRLPLTLEMSELNGNEKYCYLDDSLPSDAANPGHIEAGDLMLFGSDCLVLFYEGFDTPYSYTRIGRVEDPTGLAEALGPAAATVAFELL